MNGTKSVYKALKDAGCTIDHHQSDLYVRDTTEARQILNAYGQRFTAFKDSERAAWLEAPFAYDPYWANRLTQANA